MLRLQKPARVPLGSYTFTSRPMQGAMSVVANLFSSDTSSQRIVDVQQTDQPLLFVYHQKHRPLPSVQ